MLLLPLVPAIALVARLAGYGRSWLPSPVILVLLVALAHVLPPSLRVSGAAARTFFRRNAFALALAIIVGLTFAVRLPGIGADLGHTPIDIDENRLALSVKHFFDTGGIDHQTVEHYPGLVFWLFGGAAFVHHVGELTSGIELPPDQIPPASYVIAARIANVFVAALIVWLTGLIGCRLSGPFSALLAALLVAIVPLSIDTTTVVRNDPGMLLAVMAAVYAALVFHDTKQRTWLLAGALLAGVAAAIKYSGMFAILPVLIAAVARGTARERFRGSVVAVLCFVLAIGVTNHFIWWDFPNFLRQLTAQVALTASGHWAASDNPAGFYTMILERFGPGAVLLVLAGGYAVYALCTRRAALWIVLSFPLLYLWFMTQRPAQFPRWVFPLVPFVSIAGAAALSSLLAAAAAMATAAPSSSTRLAARAVMALIVIAALAQPAWEGVVSFSRRVTAPTHAIAEQWLESHAAPGSVVVSDVYFLDFKNSKLAVRRVDFETVMRGGDFSQLAGANYVVVPEPYFGKPLLRRLGFLQRFHAERGFGGRLGYDYEVYAVPQIPAQ